MIHYLFVYAALALSATRDAQAKNDWKKPCFQGDCSFDVAASNSSVPASLRVWGSPNAISDITDAAGWIILGCEKASSSQDIRLVCKSDDATAAGCDHLFQNGAEETLVRLPESCNKGPFARVARSWVPANQTVPQWAKDKMDLSNKRAVPQVHALALDTNFASSSGSKHGPVSFAIVGTSAPTDGVFDIPRDTNLRRGMEARGLLSSVGSVFGGVSSAISGAASSVAGAVEGAADSVNNINVNKKKTLAPVDVDKTFNLVTANADCGNLGDIELKVDAAVKAHADVSLGVVAAGTIIPPKVSTFSLQAGLNADINGDITVGASASGSPLDTGEVQLFTVGIPGLDIPDVFQIGPSFAIKGRTNLDLSIEADMKVAIAYSLSNAVFAFPPSKNTPSSGSPKPNDSPISLSVSPDVTARGSFEAHLIPELNFGIKALGNTASATVFLNMDSSAHLDLSLSGSGTLFSTAIGGSKTAAPAAAQTPTASATTTSASADASSTDAADSTGTDSDSDAATATTSADGAQETGGDDDANATSTDSDADATSTSTADDADATGTDDADATTTTDDVNTTATADDTEATATSTDDATDDADATATADDATDPTSTADNAVATATDSTDDATETSGADDEDSSSADSDTDGTSTDDTDVSDADATGSDSQDGSTDVSSDDTDANAAGDDSTAGASDDTGSDDTEDDSANDNSDDTDLNADDQAATDDTGDSQDDFDSVDDSIDGAAENTDAGDGSDEAGEDSDFGSDDTVDSAPTDDSTSTDAFDETGDDDSGLFRRAVNFNGCVDIQMGIDAKVGAEGSFFGLFDANKDFSLFKKDFELFKKCFGIGGSAERRRLHMRHRGRRHFRRSMRPTLASRKTVELTCPIKAAPKAETVVDETVRASSIRAA